MNLIDTLEKEEIARITKGKTVPSFDPGEFSSIEARKTIATIEETAVDQALEQLRERAARFEPVEDGVVGDGHTVVVDLERQPFDKEGRAGEKTRHEKVPIEIGASPGGHDRHFCVPE